MCPSVERRVPYALRSTDGNAVSCWNGHRCHRGDLNPDSVLVERHAQNAIELGKGLLSAMRWTKATIAFDMRSLKSPWDPAIGDDVQTAACAFE